MLLQRASGWKAIAVGIFVVGVALAAYFYFSRPSRALALTDRDTILLADFDNKTGDEVFDGTLDQGAGRSVGQSSFLDIFPDARIRETLRYMSRSPDERVTPASKAGGEQEFDRLLKSSRPAFPDSIHRTAC